MLCILFAYKGETKAVRLDNSVLTDHTIPSSIDLVSLSMLYQAVDLGLTVGVLTIEQA